MWDGSGVGVSEIHAYRISLTPVEKGDHRANLIDKCILEKTKTCVHSFLYSVHWNFRPYWALYLDKKLAWLSLTTFPVVLHSSNSVFQTHSQVYSVEKN